MDGIFYSFNDYMKERFGCKVYKITLDGGFTCPNRDGTLGTRGCIFCLNGSGAFTADANRPTKEQLDQAKELISKKITNGKYIAYFQSYTCTYGPVERLRKIYMEAISDHDVVAISIGTRPDCLQPEILELLDEINHIKPVIIELGLQTMHEKTAEYIRRGYPLSVFENAMADLKKYNIQVVVHMIIGLPGETDEDIISTARYIGQSGAKGIKFQLLHVLKGTDLEKEYEKGILTLPSMEEYTEIVWKCLQVIPKDMVVHRITGDGDKKSLIAPLWSGDKKKVLNYMNNKFKEYKEDGYENQT